MAAIRDDENSYICEGNSNRKELNGHQYKNINNIKLKEQLTNFSGNKNVLLNNVRDNTQLSSISNTATTEKTNNDQEISKITSTEQISEDSSTENPVLGVNSKNNNISYSEDETATSEDLVTTTSQQKVLYFKEHATNIPKSSKDQDTLCGFSSTCPTPQLQSLATKKTFLLFFCLAVVLQGMYYTYLVSVLTTIEKLFQIRSQTTGIIMSASEVGQIFGGLALPYYGGRGNRPKWMAGGIITFAIGVLLSAMPQLYLDDNDLAHSYIISDNSSKVNAANTCSYNFQNNFQNESSDLEDLNCHGEETSALTAPLIFFFSLLAVGTGYTVLQNLGFPYIDDNVTAEESPLYFGITIGVRILGPTLGFVFGSFCMRFYIHPFKTVGYGSTDPRWIGAWWLGMLFIGVVLFAVSFIIALFPKRLPNKRSNTFYTVNGHTAVKVSNHCALHNDSCCTPSTMTISCEEEYMYLKPEAIQATLTEFQDDSAKRTPMSSVQTSNNMDNHGSSCCPMISKISLCLPQTFLKSKSKSVLIQTTSQTKNNISAFLSAIVQLLKNKVLLLRTASSVLHLLPLAGLYTFLPKYLESQFNLTVHSAAIISGIGGILVMGIGIAISGYVIQKLKLSPTKVASWIALTALLYSIGMVILMFIGCSKEDYSVYEGAGQNLPCETSCQNCDRNLFSPICGSNGNSYFSACHSGCSTVTPLNTTNELMFSHCDCFPSEFTAKLGKCDSGCENIFLYVSVFCIFVFIHSTSEVGSMMLTLRCVDPSEKAMALGLVSAAVGLFCNVPCPIIYGTVIDYSCLLWKPSCDGQGACQLYDTDQFRYSFHGMTGLIMFFAFIVDLFVVKYSNRVKFDDPSSDQISKNLSDPS